MKSIGTFLVLVFFIVSCKAPTGAEDINQTQPEKVENALDKKSKEDTDENNINPDAATATEYIILL